MKTYRTHRCAHNHRTFRAFAKCTWPYLEVEGEGPYAVVNECRPHDVTLFETEKVAKKAREQLDETGCCGACGREHRVVRLELA